MATDNREKNRSRLLYLLNYLYKYTDEDHVATVADLIRELEKEEIKGNRNTIREDVKALNAAGFEVQDETGPNNSRLYHYGARTFDLPELKLLIDAVSSSKFISVKKSQELIEKITTLSSVFEAEKLVTRIYTTERIKADNPQLLYIVDMINDAIDSGRKISFQYMEYTMEKTLVKRNQGERYVNSPYALIWNEDRYYLIGYSDKRKKVVTFRVDRMCMPKILEEKSVPMPEHFHVMDYANKTFKMYDGEEQTIILECKKHVMKNLIDEFGVDIEVELISDDMFRATVTAVISKTFFGWLFTYAGEINLIGPEKVRQEYHQRIHIALHDIIKEKK